MQPFGGTDHILSSTRPSWRNAPEALELTRAGVLHTADHFTFTADNQEIGLSAEFEHGWTLITLTRWVTTYKPHQDDLNRHKVGFKPGCVWGSKLRR